MDCVRAIGPASVVRTNGDMHPLVAAVHLAFAEHRSLVLSPDVVWTTIAQGFSSHVQIHSEELRERFVKHEDKLILAISHRAGEVDPSVWPGLISQFTAKVPADANAFLADVLSSTAVAYSKSNSTLRTTLSRPAVVFVGITWRTLRQDCFDKASGEASK